MLSEKNEIANRFYANKFKKPFFVKIADSFISKIRLANR